jgi:WD40 repeat protein
MDWYEPWESVNIGEVIASVAGIDRLKIIYPDTGLVKWDYSQNGRKFISVNHRAAGFDDGLVIFYPRKPDNDSDLAELTALVGKGAIVDLTHLKHHTVIAISERGHLAEWNYTLLKYQSQVSSGTVHDFDVSMRDEMHVDKILILCEVEGLQIWYLAHSDEWTSSYSRKFRLAEYSGSKSADWSPVDSLVAIERGSTMEILKFGWASVEANATLPEKVNRVSWSPKGNLIATAGQNGTLRLWSVGGETSLSSAHTFEQDAEITALAWSPDGDRIAAGDANGYVWVWQVPQELR